MNRMRFIVMISGVVVSACLGLPAMADAPLVDCVGNGCGGSGPATYAYRVDSASYPTMEFRVGTGDLDASNYTNVLIPPGWSFAVEEEGMHHSCGFHAPHGQMSYGPCYSLTEGSAHWWTDDPHLAVEFFTFGYDHPWPSEDVGWELTTRREGQPPQYYIFRESWDGLVGWGSGPLHGPCEAVYCWSNDGCDPDDYCFFHVCAAETGICRARPESCPEDIWEPVCGCDGVTYANACEAALAGMSVDYKGECEPQYCWSNDNCDPDDYCFFHVCAVETGVCLPRPESCPDTWQPVCGCDGVTYINACQAAMAGMSVDYQGVCEGTHCWSNDDCDSDDYCFFHVCAVETGACLPRPQSCPDTWQPVCGCDGVTYINACQAAMAGMSVDYQGVCEGTYCWSNDNCKPEDYCFFHVCAVETGVCLPRPESCPDTWQPVCGCDGVTYINACMAAMSGMSVDYQGVCEGAYCWSNDDCEPDDYCFFHVCAVETGACLPRPEFCPDIWDPVCGCDGVTYPNACEAAMAGMSVDYKGPCICTGNSDCAPDQFCEYPLGKCEPPGTCQQRPDIVPPCWDPVCGCDRVTYANVWCAAKVGVSVDFEGACDGGDLDGDGDVDLDDYVVFQGCLTGSGTPPPLPCIDADLDYDNDVDLLDFRRFQARFSPTPPSPYVAEYSNSGCLDRTRDEYPPCGDNEIVLTVEGNTLNVLHLNATYNCCPDDIVISLTVEGDVLRLTEEEILTNPCYCICCYEVRARIVDLPSGEYTVEFCWYDYETYVEMCYTEDIVIP